MLPSRNNVQKNTYREWRELAVYDSFFTHLLKEYAYIVTQSVLLEKRKYNNIYEDKIEKEDISTRKQENCKNNVKKSLTSESFCLIINKLSHANEWYIHNAIRHCDRDEKKFLTNSSEFAKIYKSSRDGR
jgi:hypothetical protein